MDFTQEYNRATWLNFLENSFLPDDFRVTKEAVPYNGNFSKEVTKLGECPSLQLSVFEMNHTSVNDARVGLSKEAFALVRDYTKYNRALALFVPQNSNDLYRFSYVEFTPVVNDKGKIKREFSNPRRFSYLLGENCKKHTPESMLITKGSVKSGDDLVSRFAIEVVTKKFYQELFKWYDSWAVHLANFPTGIGSHAARSQKPDVEKNRQHLIRLITRLIFVWFLRQKNNLVPKWIFDEKEISKILSNFDAKSDKQGTYYNGIIQNLFFATLNKRIKERKFANYDEADRKDDYGIKTKFRDFNNVSLFSNTYNPTNNSQVFIELFNSIPFLNGGLFECLDGFDTKEYADGFSREKNRAAFVPNCLFWGDNDHEGLIPLLNRYNFTIEENTPQDIDIALDPELLGKVFENLLGTYNEETSSTARNESGSFYTPREIVDYMVDTSLKEYFKGKLNSNENAFNEKLDKLFLYHESDHDFDNKQAALLMDAINNCKILDPACGSGAFPMGVLNKLAFIMQKLDPKNEIWREIQIKKAIEDTAKAYGIESRERRDKRLNEIKEVFDMGTGEYSNYARKLFLIENCIYGIDIQPIAIQISKLRFFISLIADQKTGGNIDNNYNILPLPNLETKFVAANTLIGVKRDKNILADPAIGEKQKELLAVRHSHFSVRDVYEKIHLRKRDELLSKELSDLLRKDGFYTSSEAEQLAKWNPYTQTAPSEVFDAYWMFGVNDGFDVVIGNPPYIQLQNNHGELADKYNNQNYECFSRSGDIYQLFYESCYNLLKENGHLCFITSNKWMRTAYGEKTRIFFANKTNPKMLIDFAGQRVFESATVDVNIILLEKNKNGQKTSGCIIKEDCKNNMTDYIKQHGSTLEFLSGNSWVILNPIEKKIKEKIERMGMPLKDWDISINYGIKTGCNEAFIIDKQKRDEIIKKDKKSAQIIRPILRGRDIKRYGYEFAEQYIIATFPSRKYDIDDYPAVRDYLLKFGKQRLEQSGKPGARKKTSHKWFETQDPITYWDDFSKHKIVWKRVGSILRFCYDEARHLVLDSTCFATGKDLKYILAVLNSNIGYYMLQNSPKTGTGDLLISVQAIEPLQIPEISDNDKCKVINLVDTLLSLKNASNIAEIESKINYIIYKFYNFTEEEIVFLQSIFP